MRYTPTAVVRSAVLRGSVETVPAARTQHKRSVAPPVPEINPSFRGGEKEQALACGFAHRIRPAQRFGGLHNEWVCGLNQG